MQEKHANAERILIAIVALAMFIVIAVIVVVGNSPRGSARATATPTQIPFTTRVTGQGGPGFNATLSVTWEHSASGALVCWTLATDPPLRGGLAKESIDGPGVVGAREANIPTDNIGQAKGAFVVNRPGTYTVTGQVSSLTLTQKVDVAEGPGPRPCG